MIDNSPFFVVGAGRSGTTLLRLILLGHSRIEIPPETWFILPLVRQFSLRDTLTPEQVAQAIGAMVGDYRWPDMGIDADDFRARVTALQSVRLVDLLDVVYRHHLDAAGKTRLGDKTPPYVEILPELSVLYPGAKFIHMVRDGRDVAISHIEIGWDSSGCRCYERNFEWTHSLRLRMAYRHSALDQRILDVKYEELVREPEVQLRRICSFLGEDFEPEMLDWATRQERVPERERSIHTKLGRPLSTDAISRWRKTLSAFECFIMEACLQKDLRQWGYSLRFSSSTWFPALVLAGWFLYSLGPLMTKVIPYLRRRNLLPRRIYI